MSMFPIDTSLNNITPYYQEVEPQYCVNCGYHLNYDEPVPLSGLAPHQMRILNNWMPHVNFLHNDCICRQCHKKVAAVRENSLFIPDREYGHRSVCVGCGASVRTRASRQHILDEDSPEMDVIRTWPSTPRNYAVAKACHFCWSRASKTLSLKQLPQDGGSVRPDDSATPPSAAPSTPNDPPVTLTESDAFSSVTKVSEQTQADCASPSARESHFKLRQIAGKWNLLKSEKVRNVNDVKLKKNDNSVSRQKSSSSFEQKARRKRWRAGFGECYCCSGEGRLQDTLYSTCEIINGKPWSYITIIRAMYRISLRELNNITMNKAANNLLICLDCQLIVKESFQFYKTFLNNVSGYHKRKNELIHQQIKKGLFKATLKTSGLLDDKINSSLQQLKGTQHREKEIKVDDRGSNNEHCEKEAENKSPKIPNTKVVPENKPKMLSFRRTKLNNDDGKKIECTTITNNDRGFASEVAFTLVKVENDLLEEISETIKEENYVSEEEFATTNEGYSISEGRFETIKGENTFKVKEEKYAFDEEHKIVNVEENGVSKEETEGECSQFGKSFKTMKEENGFEEDYDKARENALGILESDGGVPPFTFTKKYKLYSNNKISENCIMNTNENEIKFVKPTELIKLEYFSQGEASKKSLSDNNDTITSEKHRNDPQFDNRQITFIVKKQKALREEIKQTNKVPSKRRKPGGTFT